MKKTIVGVVMCAAIAATAGAAAAADTFNLTVTAQVAGTCKIVLPNSGTLDIGLLDFDASGNSLGKASGGVADLTFQYWCTKGLDATYDIQDPGGSFAKTTVNRARTLTSVSTPAETIPYTLILTDAGRNAGDTPAVKTIVTIDASVAAGTYDTAAALNDYQDTVVITLTP